MAHIHNVFDTDAHYKIDGITRTIINVDETKRMLVQGDHNSERFTFEIPRYIDGHDFLSCNSVQVHFLNQDPYGKSKSTGIFDVDDLHAKESDSDKTVLLSWLISGLATKYVGSLDFTIRFSCISEEGIIEYAWNTTTFKGIEIKPGIFNSQTIVENNYDMMGELLRRVQVLESQLVKYPAAEEVSV